MNTKKLKKYQIFKLLCFAEDIKSVYDELIENNVISKQEFDEDYQHSLYSPSKTCRHCKKEVEEDDFDYVASYWTPNKWFIVHKDCKKDCKKAEAYDCQSIDCSCNDCIFFERLEQNKGNCKKKDKQVYANSNQCSPENQDCFVHRLDEN